jgi:transposase
MISPLLSLSKGEMQKVKRFCSHGEHLAREVTRAHILSALSQAAPIASIQQVLGVSRMVIWRTRAAYDERGLDFALKDAPRPGRPSKYGTDQEAEIVALACSQPPAGAARWTLRLLTAAARQRPLLREVNRESVRLFLKKTSVNLGAKLCGASEK